MANCRKDARADAGRARVLIWSGRKDESRAALARLQANDATNIDWTIGMPGQIAAVYARIDLVQGHAQSALDRLRGTIDKTRAGPASSSAELASILVFKTLLAGEAEARLGHAPAARSWREQTLSGLDTMCDCAPGNLTTRFAALKHLGRLAEAGRIVHDLDQWGYRDPAYIALRYGPVRVPARAMAV